MDTPSADYFRIEGATFAVKSGLWRAHVENDPDCGALGDQRIFLLRFDLIEPYGNWSGEAVRSLTLTTSRAALVIENLGAFLPLVVDGFLLEEKPEGEKTCFRRD